jgi:hypothetical protein
MCRFEILAELYLHVTTPCNRFLIPYKASKAQNEADSQVHIPVYPYPENKNPARGGIHGRLVLFVA